MSTEPKAPLSDDAATREDDDVPTLCIRLRNGIPETEHDPRLKRLDYIDRDALLIWAREALAITPLEFLQHGSIFFSISSAYDPAMRERLLIVSRVMRALHYEAQENDSAFLKSADSQARSILARHGFDMLFSARAAAFVRIRDLMIPQLQQNMESDTLSIFLLLDLADPQCHEIARHIPGLNTEMVSREIGTSRYKRAKKALHRARHSKTAERDVTTQAECMIRAWLRAMGCPEEIVKSAFDAERAREERELGQRK